VRPAGTKTKECKCLGYKHIEGREGRCYNRGNKHFPGITEGFFSPEGLFLWSSARGNGCPQKFKTVYEDW